MIIWDWVALLGGVSTLAGLECWRRWRRRHDPMHLWLLALENGQSSPAAPLEPGRSSLSRLPGLALLVLAGATITSACLSLGAPRFRPIPVEGGSLLPARTGSSPGETELAAGVRKLAALARTLPPPRPGDWRFHHHEPSQSLAQYIASRPVRTDQKRSTLYLQPLGKLSASQRKIIELTGRFLRSYYCTGVRIVDGVSLDGVPPGARRYRIGEAPQILSGHLLLEVLRPRLPADAVCMLGLTATDLWPGRGWNFVFGEATLHERVGVWSLHRFGDPDRGRAAFAAVLLRTLKVAAHETGHMFSMFHCTQHRCLMNGSNSLPETDESPISLCPECWAKITFANRCDPDLRFKELQAFFAEVGLTAEADHYRSRRKALRPDQPPLQPR